MISNQHISKTQRLLTVLITGIVCWAKAPFALANVPPDTYFFSVVVLGFRLYFGFVEYIVFYTVLNLIIEIPVFFILGFKTKKSLILAAIVNIITLPVFYVSMSLTSKSIWLGTPYFAVLCIIIAELIIITFEWLVLTLFLRKEIRIRRILLATVAANVTSIAVGVLLAIIL